MKQDNKIFDLPIQATYFRRNYAA